MANIGLEEILEMDESELFEYIIRECIAKGVHFDIDMLDGSDRQSLYDFIADHINTELQAELHSECRLSPGCGMFPNAENQDDIDEALEHELSRD